MKLYSWQAECLKCWTQNHYRGIANVVTGAGKTVLALSAASMLEDAVGEIKVKIIVPKTFLVRQWFNALISIAGVSRSEIGIFTGMHKSNTNRKYMIYVINSARYTFTRHMLEDSKSRVLVIADECHHYGAPENAHIFDFIELISDAAPYYTLGLSATPYSKNYADILVPALGREIYHFDFVKALHARIISDFSLFHIALTFHELERFEYDELTDKLIIAMRKLKKICPQLYYSKNYSFFAQLEMIAQNHSSLDIRELAQAVSFLLLKRKEVVYTARARIRCVVDLVQLLGNRPKIIIFGERIDMAELIFTELHRIMPGEVGVYHSKQHENIRKIRLRDFETSRLRILVSCKTLDEGLDISDTDIGIVASSTSSERQRIQRLGRVLRKKDGKKQARFYYLYVKDTVESEEVLGDISERLSDQVNVVDLDYHEPTQDFGSAPYDLLTEKALADARDRGWNDDKMAELYRNIQLGAISCDWLMNEMECRQKIAFSSAKRDRNYYTAMLMLAQAREELSSQDSAKN